MHFGWRAQYAFHEKIMAVWQISLASNNTKIYMSLGRPITKLVIDELTHSIPHMYMSICDIPVLKQQPHL